MYMSSYSLTGKSADVLFAHVILFILYFFPLEIKIHSFIFSFINMVLRRDKELLLLQQQT